MVCFAREKPEEDQPQQPGEEIQLKRPGEESFQGFEHPMKHCHHKQAEPNKRDHSSTSTPAGITAPRRTMRQHPFSTQTNTVLAWPEG